jgi:radical SAM protein with 4Fe4S-binding SPASM domain
MKADPPIHLGAYMTTRCNQKCTYCKSADFRSNGVPDMTGAMVKRILGVFPSIGRIKVGAPGEPLSSPEFPGVVRAGLRAGRKVAIGTNGTLITRLQDAIPWQRVNVNVSITDPDPERYQAVTGTKLLSRALDGIEYLNTQDTRVSMSYVIHKGNIDRIPAFLRLAKELQPKRVVLQSICGHYDVSSAEDLAACTHFWKHEALRIDDRVSIQRLRAQRRAIKKFYSGRVLWPRLLDPKSPGTGCLMSKTYIAVDGNGDVALCCGGPGPRPEMGNIRQGASVWNSNPMARLRSRIFSGSGARQPHKCRVCRANYGVRV